MDIFGTICSTDQLEIMQGGIIQAEMMIFHKELQMTSTHPAGKLLILLCSAGAQAHEITTQ